MNDGVHGNTLNTPVAQRTGPTVMANENILDAFTQQLHYREASAFGWAGVDCSEPRGASSTPIPTRVRFVGGRLSVK
jgi:hypothetical protein